MKFLKKTAALLFCLTLALSVMAVSALATEDDTAELLAVSTVSNTDFVVTLTKASSQTSILDRDNVSGYEINASDTITFDINLAYTGSGEGAFSAGTNTINGFQFDFVPDENEGVTISAVTIKSTTVTAGGTRYTNTYAYTSAGSSDNDIAIATSATSIGTITFAFTGATPGANTGNTAITPTIKNILIQVRGTESMQHPADAGTDTPVYVNPVYAVTVEHFEANSTTGVAQKQASTNDTTVYYNFTSGGTLTNEAPIPGYEFKGWMVTTDTNNSETWSAYSGSWVKNVYFSVDSAWSAFTPVTSGVIDFIAVDTSDGATATAISAGQVGAITLTPVYTATTYMVTFNSGDTDATFAATADNVDNDRLTRTKTYTIEDLAADGSGESDADFLDIKRTVETQNKTLARTGFKFVGWEPSNSTVAEADTDYVWDTDTTTSTLATPVRIITDPSTKHYGHLTLTAVWELDIYFAKIQYQYAGSANAMILVAVPSGTGSNYNAAYTYKCNDNAMFIIPSSGQRTAYVNTAFTSANLTDTYVIYAYIAVANTEPSAITLDESAETSNVPIAYNGDVDDSEIINVGDFGNVDTLLGAPENTTVFAISSSDGVKARLQADASTDTTGATLFGSIADVKAIYNGMGYSLT